LSRGRRGKHQADWLHSCRPKNIPNRDELLADLYSFRRDIGHPGIQPHFDTHLLEIALRVCAQLGRELRQHPVSALEDDDAGSSRIDVPVVFLERVPGDLLDRTGKFDAGGSGSDDPESERGTSSVVAPFVLSGFKGEENAPPQFRSVFEAFQPGGNGSPFLTAEVGVRRAGSEDEVIVVCPAVVKKQRRFSTSTPITSASPTSQFSWSRRIPGSVS
jgi:hypothetical protein